MILKAGFARFLPAGSKLRDSKYRNQLSVFLACVAISSFVWVVIKLSKDYTLSVTWPVEYENVPGGQVLAIRSDTSLIFQIRARGFDLLPTFIKGPSQKVSIDLANIRFLRDKGRLRNAYLLTSELKTRLAGQLNLNEGLVSIQPDTLFFQLAPMHSKKVPVVPRVSYQLAPTFGLYENITVEPDSIRIDGPAAYIDTIRFVQTKKKNAGVLSADYSVKTDLSGIYKSMPLNFSRQSFVVKIPVEKYTEATIQVPVVNSDSCHIRFFPEKVSLVCQVAMRDYKRLDPSVFIMQVNCSDAFASSSRFITPRLRSQPSFVKVVRIEPAQVEFIILK